MNTLKQTFQKQIIFIFYLQPLSSLHLKNHACNKRYMSENPWKSQNNPSEMWQVTYSLSKSPFKKRNKTTKSNKSHAT
jgi:hypothetical protein